MLLSLKNMINYRYPQSVDQHKRVSDGIQFEFKEIEACKEYSNQYQQIVERQNLSDREKFSGVGENQDPQNKFCYKERLKPYVSKLPFTEKHMKHIDKENVPPPFQLNKIPGDFFFVDKCEAQQRTKKRQEGILIKKKGEQKKDDPRILEMFYFHD